MKKSIKKIISIALALCIVFSKMCVVVMAETREYDKIYLDTPVEIAISSNQSTNYFYFTPNESGLYSFSSSGDGQGHGYILDENYRTLASEGYNYNTNNFKVCAELTAGQKYVLKSTVYRIYNSDSLYTVIVEKSNIESIVFDDITITDWNTNFYYNSETGNYDLECKHYDYDNKVTGTITYTDGTTAKIERGHYIDDSYQQISYSDNQSSSYQWFVGNSYNVTARLFGITSEFTVTVAEAPKISSVTAEPMYFRKGRNGYDYGDFFYYHINAYSTTVTVTLEDGTVLTNLENGLNTDNIKYNNESFHISLNAEQSSQNPLLPNNTYDVTVFVMGETCVTNVTILEAPKAESVTAEPITIIEGTNGSDYGDYYYYDLSASDTKVTVTLTDGTVLYNDGSYIYYDGDSYDIDFSIEQNAENPLLPNNTYYATVSVLGATCQVPVTITENPIESIEVLEAKPVYTCDYSHISEGTPIYHTPDFNLKVNFENGDYIILRGGAGVSSDNQHVTPWTVGGENLVTVSYMGKTTQFSVQLVEKNAKLFEYEVQDGVAYITKCNASTENLVIPSEIDGYPVKGIIDLVGSRELTFKELTIPDSVTYVTGTALRGVEVVNLGSGIEELGYWHSYELVNLKEINVSTSNKNYASVDGVLYNKNLDKLIFYPLAKGDTYSVPSTVIDFSVLYDDIYADLNISFDAGSDAYVTADGVTYTKDMKMVLSCNPEKTGEYVMPNTVTSIAKGAFSNSSLSKITVSSNVTEIVYAAFSHTVNLETVILPSNLKRIELGAFYGSAISSITLPNGLEEIGKSAFRETHNLTKIEIPGSVKNISDYAFDETTSLFEIILNEGVENIGYHAFSMSGDNVKTGQVRLPSTLKNIGASAFRGRKNITEITIPVSVTNIGAAAFEYCSELKTANITGDNVSINDYAFSDCSKLKTVNIEGNGVTIGEYAFQNSPIENFDFDKVSGRICQRSFKNSNLTGVVFPETVTEISYGAFENSKYLEEVDFSETIITLDPDAFNGTPWYENVYSELDDGWVIYDNIFFGYKGDFAKVKNTAPVLPEGVTSIVSDSMQYTSFSSITLPKSLRVIGIGAFQYNENLSSIYIPENVEYIADTAFFACSSLTDIQVAENNQYYTAKDGVLYNKDMTKLIFCGKQESAVFRVPSTVKNIADGAFYASGVKYIIFENSNVSLDNNNYNTGYGEELSVQKTIDGITFDEALPILVCDKSADSKIYAFAQEEILYTIDINSLTAESIELEGTPKTMFNVGDKFVQDDLKLKVNYNEFSEIIDITPEMVSGFDSSVIGNQTVTFTYMGKTTSLNVSVVGAVAIPSKSVRPGETFNLILNINAPINCTSFAISNIIYDTTKMELVSGEWLLNDTTTADWDKSNQNGVANFEENTLINGNFFKLTFKIKEGIEEADATVDCDVLIREIHNDVVCDIPVDVASATIKIRNALVGDLDGDNELTDWDGVLLARYLAGWNVEITTLDALDIDGDGEITDWDGVVLDRYLAGWNVSIG